MSRGNVYSVSQVSSYIKNMFAQDYLLAKISVKGEVSNCTYHSKGHIYFTLKDKSSVISCVMWKMDRAGLSFCLKEGMQVIASGQVGVYEATGKYQLYVSGIEEDGVGDLYLEYLALKQELEERGMFDPMYKRPIPSGCRTLGIVTAPTGAAVRDIISIAQTRNPYIQIVLYPALVQGRESAPDIAAGIKALEDYGVDIIIVGRGGGSLEDLWAFNEELVAQAIFDCSIPVISAVGHETDTTIADFVADKRAETPSAGAVIAVQDIAAGLRRLEELKQRLQREMDNAMAMNRRKLGIISDGIYSSIRDRLIRSTMDVRVLKERLGTFNPAVVIRERRQRCLYLEEELKGEMETLIERKKHILMLLLKELEGVSPMLRLSSGYAYTENQNRECITSIAGVSVGELISIYIKDGILDARVENIRGKEYGTEENR